jgi:hypothetical protein
MGEEMFARVLAQWKKNNKQRQLAVIIIASFLSFLIIFPFIVLGKTLRFICRIMEAVAGFFKNNRS